MYNISYTCLVEHNYSGPLSRDLLHGTAVYIRLLNMYTSVERPPSIKTISRCNLGGLTRGGPLYWCLVVPECIDCWQKVNCHGGESWLVHWIIPSRADHSLQSMNVSCVCMRTEYIKCFESLVRYTNSREDSSDRIQHEAMT